MDEPLVRPNGKDKEMTDEIYPEGTLLEVLETSRNEETGENCRRGQKFIVEDYAPKTDDPNLMSEIYIGSEQDGCSVEAHKDNVKFLLTAKAAKERKLPDSRTILRELDLLGETYAGYDFHETNVLNDELIEAYGTTPDGLNFGIQLKVTAIFHTDF